MNISGLDVDGGREQCPQSKFGVMTGPAMTAITAARTPYITPNAINVKLFYGAFVVLAPLFNGMMLLLESQNKQYWKSSSGRTTIKR